MKPARYIKAMPPGSTKRNGAKSAFVTQDKKRWAKARKRIEASRRNMGARG